MVAVHQAARPAPGERRPGKASQVCMAPPAVKKIEPTKKVTPTAVAPTNCAYPGNGPTRKHADPIANSRAIHRSRLTAMRLYPCATAASTAAAGPVASAAA